MGDTKESPEPAGPLGLIDRLGAAVLALERDGRVSHANPAASAMFGRTEQEMIGRPASELVRRPGAGIHAAIAEARAAAGVRADGVEFPIELRVTPLASPGAEGASLVEVRDISEEIQAQDDLHLAQRRLAEAEQLARVGSWEWDIPAGVVTWSDQLFRIYGLEPGSIEPTYERFLGYVHPDDRDDVDARNRQAFADHQPFADVKRVVRADGREIQMRTQGEVFCDASGAPIRMVGVCEDVTDEHRASELLSRLWSIVQSTGDAIVGLDAGGRITSWNPAAERLYGYATDAVHGQDVAALLDTSGGLRTAIDAAVDLGVITHLEAEQIRGDGQHVGVALTVSPIVRDDGHIDGVSLIGRALPRPLAA